MDHEAGTMRCSECGTEVAAGVEQCPTCAHAIVTPPPPPPPHVVPTPNVLPAMVVQGIWKRSPSIDQYGYRHEESGARVGWWWITWIVSSMFVRLAGSCGSTRPTAEELSTGDSLRTVGVLFAIGAAVQLIGVVRRLAARQAVLSSSPPPVAPAVAVVPGTWTPPV